MKDWNVQYLVVSLNWLTVQTKAHSQSKNHLREGIRKSKDFVITCKTYNMRDNTKHRIVVRKEDIGLSALKLTSLHNQKWVLMHDYFCFCYDLIFLKWSWRIRVTFSVFLLCSTNRSILLYVIPSRASGLELMNAVNNRIVTTYNQ